MVDDVVRTGMAEQRSDRIAMHHARGIVDLPQGARNGAAALVEIVEPAARVDGVALEQIEKRPPLIAQPLTVVRARSPARRKVLVVRQWHIPFHQKSEL